MRRKSWLISPPRKINFELGVPFVAKTTRECAQRWEIWWCRRYDVCVCVVQGERQTHRPCLNIQECVTLIWPEMQICYPIHVRAVRDMRCRRLKCVCVVWVERQTHRPCLRFNALWKNRKVRNGIATPAVHFDWGSLCARVVDPSHQRRIQWYADRFMPSLLHHVTNVHLLHVLVVRNFSESWVTCLSRRVSVQRFSGVT